MRSRSGLNWSGFGKTLADQVLDALDAMKRVHIEKGQSGRKGNAEEKLSLLLFFLEGEGGGVKGWNVPFYV